MVQKDIAISVIAAVAVAGILIFAILATVTSTNQAFAYNSYKNYKGHHGFYYKSSRYTRQGNIQASKSVTTSNAASNTVAQGGPSGQPSGAVQGTSQKSSIGANEKSCALRLNVSPATMGASSYNVNGRLTCGGSGVGGAPIAFTANGKFYGPEILKRVVTGSDGSFSQTTAQPLSKVEARYSGELGANAPVQATFSLTGAGTSQQASNAGNAPQGASTTVNAAQGASNTGQGGPSSQPSGGNVGQGGTSSQAGHCKPTITLSAQWYPPYRNYMIRGTLTCGGTGLSGKTITLTSTHVSYFGRIGTVVTGEDGSFFKSYKPASTAKPLTTLSAWYLGGPIGGGIPSKVVTVTGGPPQQQSSNNGNAAQQSSNNGNTEQEKGASNNGNTEQEKGASNNGNTEQEKGAGNGAESSNTGNGGHKGTGQGGS